jgi:hypothetical protein
LGNGSSCTLCNSFHQCCLCYTKLNTWQIKHKFSELKIITRNCCTKARCYLAGWYQLVKWGNGDTACLTFALDGGVWLASCPVHFTSLEKESLAHSEYEAGWAPELIWMVWRSKQIMEGLYIYSLFSQ